MRFFYRPLFRLVPDGTRIKFMRGRFAGLMVSAVLSLASVGLFFYPGLRLGIDFKGGVVMEVRTAQAPSFPALRAALAAHDLPDAGLQSLGGKNEVMIRLESRANAQATDAAVARVHDALDQHQRRRRLGLGPALPPGADGAWPLAADDPGLYLVPL